MEVNISLRLIQSPRIGLLSLASLLVCVFVFALTVGTSPITFGTVISSLFGYEANPHYLVVIQEIRLPRVLLGLMVGAGLGIAGAVMQGLFRNPLADPALVGVSSGAALAAVTVIVLGANVLSQWVFFWGILALPLAAFIGGGLVTWLIYQIATKNGQTDVSLMLLTGIAINAIAGALTALLTYSASDSELRTLTFWAMGSLASATWQDLFLVFPPLLLALILLPLYARGLNAFLLGESVSYHSGFDVRRLKIATITLTALAVGAAVSVSGVIGFVGLVAPHLARLLLGPDHRWMLLGSALIGGLLVLVSDILARMLLAPMELPIGIVMSAIGGPFFLWLLIQRRNRVGF